MKSDELLNGIVLNYHTALFLKEFEICIKENPQCTVEQFRAQFINNHEILRRSEELYPFSLFHQGVAFSLAYSLFVLPFESADEMKKWNPTINSLQKFNIIKKPDSFTGSTYDWLRLIRNSIAHGHIKITPKYGGEHGDACFEIWNYQGGDRKKPINFICTCSYLAFQEFLDEFFKKFLKWKLPSITVKD